ncbi:MAG: heme-copper oxidase subunit III [Phycisphaerales bacterium JB038]
MTNEANDNTTTVDSDSSADFERPPGTGTFGMVLFLMSLTMLFGASLIGYGIIRGRVEGIEVVLPLPLWFSTGVLVVSSAFLHYAGLSLRAGHLKAFKMGLLIALLLGVAFCVVQAPGLYGLVSQHEAARESNVYLFALIVFLVIVHGLHVIGGLLPMAVVLSKAFAEHYGPNNAEPVRRLTMYWHFLDGVWMVMFSTFLVLG